MECLIAVRPDGEVAWVYDDALQALLEEGEAVIRRASHVEPTPDGRWQADLAPVGGPKLSTTLHRAASIDAETAWIERHVLGRTPNEEGIYPP